MKEKYIETNEDENLNDKSTKRQNKTKKPKIYIEMSLCKYQLIRNCAKDMKWVDNKGKDSKFTIFWMDSACAPERVMKLESYQIINHFPQMNQICRKIPLAKNLKKMYSKFPKQYTFFPMTYILPHELGQFMKPNPKIDDKFFIIKSSTGSQGKGIVITKDKSEAQKFGDAVVQVYVDDPYLIDDYKFDLRIYVLVRSVDPLEVYVYNEGLVRVCTEKYQPPTIRNLANQFMHLSNYSINKNNKNFTSGDTNDDPTFSSGSKRSFRFFNEYLDKNGHSSSKIWKKIYSVINKTIISIHPELVRSYRSCMTNGKVGRFHCFEILGFDVMLDKKMKPILLEVNHSPSWNTDTALDLMVKEGLISETMKLLTIDPIERDQALKRMKDETVERLQSRESHIDDQLQIQRKCEIQEDLHELAERKYLKNYVKIYPPKSENLKKKFDQLIEYAESVEREAGRSFSSASLWKKNENTSNLNNNTEPISLSRKETITKPGSQGKQKPLSTTTSSDVSKSEHIQTYKKGPISLVVKKKSKSTQENKEPNQMKIKKFDYKSIPIKPKPTIQQRAVPQKTFEWNFTMESSRPSSELGLVTPKPRAALKSTKYPQVNEGGMRRPISVDSMLSTYRDTISNTLDNPNSSRINTSVPILSNSENNILDLRPTVSVIRPTSHPIPNLNPNPNSNHANITYQMNGSWIYSKDTDDLSNIIAQNDSLLKRYGSHDSLTSF